MGQRNEVGSAKAIIDSVSDPIFALDSDGIITLWNDAASELFGYSSPEAVDSSIVGLLNLHDTNRQKIYSLLTQSESGSTNEATESVSINAMGAAGDSIHVELERIQTQPAIFLANPIDQPIQTEANTDFFDISVYRLAIEQSSNLIAAVDHDERLLFANQR